MKRWQTPFTGLHWRDARLLTLSDQALGSGVSFVLGLLLARTLGLEGFGTFSLFWLLLQVAQSLNQALIIQPLMSLGPGRRDFVAFCKGLWGFAWIAALSWAALAALCCGLAAWAGWQPGGEYALAFPLWLASTGLLDYLRRQAFAAQQVLSALVMQAVAQGSGLTALIIVLQTGHLNGATAVLWLSAGNAAAILIGLRAHAAPEMRPARLRVWQRRLWPYSRWLLGTAVLQWLAGQSYTLLSGLWLGPAALGVLRLAQQTLGLLHVLYQSLENYLPVRSAQVLASKGEAAMRSYLLRHGLRLSFLNGLLLLAVGLLSPMLYRLFYGPELISSAWMLVWLLPAYALIIPNLPLRMSARSTGNTHIILRAYAAAAILTLPFAPWILAHFGLRGAAAGLFLNQLILLLFMSWPDRKIWKTTWQSYISSSAKPIPNA